MPERHFVKYTFLKVDPAWRRLDDAERAQHKREFLAACEDFAAERLLRAFSLVGTRGDADLMLLSQATNLERIHEFHVVLAQSGLMKWCETPYSFLALTKPSEYSDESRLEVRPAHGKYLFVYPFVKTREWYRLAPDERWRIMQEHIKVGREYPQIDLNTSYSFGLDDQEFVVAFETDEPASFLDLVQRLRTTEASAYTKRDTPTFTCVGCSVERALCCARRHAADRRAHRLRISLVGGSASAVSASSNPTTALVTSAGSSLPPAIGARTSGISARAWQRPVCRVHPRVYISSSGIGVVGSK